ncbi:hypothetical protein ACQ5SP_08355 [Rhodovulum sp. YNF3179]|uniref:hypothetical protein n=1 Tax=Rhodovulum sp. YNF3179 TaxID=3425127 RepID=UPI003D34E854
MGKLVIGLLGLVVGLVGGAIFGGALIGGAATGVGIATGLSAGICSTVQAAQEEGLLTAEQVDQVLLRAAQDMGGSEVVADGSEMVGSAAECDAVMQRLRSEAGE